MLAAYGKQTSIAELAMPERVRQMHREGVQRWLQTHRPGRVMEPFAVNALHKDGTEVPVEIVVVPRQNVTTGEWEFVGTVRKLIRV